MDDWPTTSWRTRVFATVAIALLLLQGTLVTLGIGGAASHAAVNALGALVVLGAIGMTAWSTSMNRDAGVRAMGAVLTIGILLRVIGLIEFTYLAPPTPPAMPNLPTSWVLIASYVVLSAGVGGTVLALSRRVADVRGPFVVGVAAALVVGGALALAAFGPLPAAATVLTVRDHFAIGLLVADSMLLGLAVFTAAALLQLPGGTLSRAWVWIAMALVVAVMGDAVMPLLEPADAANYTSLLWGLGYILAAVGASIVVDIERWHISRGEPMLAAALRGEARAK